MMYLTKQEAKNEVEKVNSSGWFKSEEPIFCQNRTDVCALIRHEETGFDSIYLVWKDFEGKIKNSRISSYKLKEGFLNIKEIIKTRTQIIIEVENNGRKFGSFWVPLRGLNLKDSFI